AVCSCDNVIPDPQLLADVECQRNYGFGAGADRRRVFDNLLPVDPNTSAASGWYSDPPNDPCAALRVEFGGPVDLSVFNQFQIQATTSTAGPILFKLEGGDTSDPYEVWQDLERTGQWETLTV